MRLSLIVALAALFGNPVASSFAEPAADFFRSKTIKLMVGTSTGGGYDLYARMIAPYLEQQIGARIIIENRPGGSHMVALNAVFTAPPDGLSLILASAEGAVLGKLVEEPGIRFDLSAFPIIGRVNTAPRVLIVNPSLPFKSVKELQSSARQLTLGFAGLTDGGSDTGMIMCYALNLKCKSIIGYPSSKEFSMAAVKGEVDGTVLADDSAVRFSDSGDLRMLAVIGRTRSALAPDVPTIFEASVISEDSAWWLDLRDDIRKLGRLLVTTPGTPDDRVEFLRNATRVAMTDRRNQSEFEKRGMPVQFAPANEMAPIVKRLLGGELSKEKRAEMKHIITEKYYR